MSLQRSQVILIGIFISVAACAQSLHIEHSKLLAALAEINGSYHWNIQLKRYVFSEKQTIETILSSKDSDFLVRTLVDCLSNRTRTNSVIRNKKALLGVICYEALSQTAYYEPITETGDIAESWPGHLLPTATPDELLKAKHAWKKVVESKTYILF